jgi:YD repeat-containing protein
MLPVHDTDGVVDAIASGGYTELSRLVSCTSLDGTVTYSYDRAGQLIGADYSDESIRDESCEANG